MIEVARNPYGVSLLPWSNPSAKFPESYARLPRQHTDLAELLGTNSYAQGVASASVRIAKNHPSG